MMNWFINIIKKNLPKAESMRKLKALAWLRAMTSNKRTAVPILFLLTRVVCIYKYSYIIIFKTTILIKMGNFSLFNKLLS